MTFALMVLLGALVGALIQRFVMSRLSRYRHADLDGWMILIEDGAKAARTASEQGVIPDFMRMLSNDAPGPEERAFVYGWYRQLVPDTEALPIGVRPERDDHGFGPDRA